MGQKVNPIIQRIGINTEWVSNWYSDKFSYSANIYEDFKIRSKICSFLSKGLVEKIFIERLHNKCIITIYSPKPGMLIGRKGYDVDLLKKSLEKISLSSISLNISELKKPELSASLIAQSVCMQIEKRVSYKKVLKRSVSLAMRAGAKGVKISCSGRLGGAEIARSEYVKEGKIPLHTLRAKIDYALQTAYTPYGICGVKVWVNK